MQSHRLMMLCRLIVEAFAAPHLANSRCGRSSRVRRRLVFVRLGDTHQEIQKPLGTRPGVTPAFDNLADRPGLDVGVRKVREHAYPDAPAYLFLLEQGRPYVATGYSATAAVPSGLKTTPLN